MVNLTTTYDSSVKEKVFVLKGDEGYARTTDMILNLLEYGNSYDNIETMRVGLAMNVLRDIGESTIVIYNGDKVLRTIQWSDTPSQMTFDDDLTWDETNQLLIWGDSSDTSKGVNLPYETEHNIYARYMGSKQCMMSVSDTISINEPVPPKYISTMTNNAQSDVYDSDGQFTLSVRVQCTTGVSTSRPYDIDVYVDGEFYHTYSGTITANATTLIRNMIVNGSGMPTVEKGKHHIRAYFRGDEYTSSCELEWDISFGYNLEVTSYDSPFIYAQQWAYDPWDRISVKLTNHFGDPVYNEDVTVEFSSPNGTVYAYGSTDTNGVIDMNVMDNDDVMNLMPNARSLQTRAFTSETVDEYSTEEFDIPVFTWGSISLSTSKDIIAPNMETTITATVSPVYKGLPIYFGSEYGTYYTDENGVASFIIEGQGNGRNYISGFIGSEIWGSTEFWDYLQYWNSTTNTLLNQRATVFNMYWTSSASGYQFRPVKLGERSYMLLEDDNYNLPEENWSLYFNVVGIANCTPFIQSQSISGLKNGDMIQVTKTQETGQSPKIRIYKNGSMITERTQSSERDGFPMIGLVPSVSANLNQTYFTINNIRLIRDYSEGA